MLSFPTRGAKICGLSTPETVATAVKAGATFIGFVFFPKSPRNVSAEQAAALGAPVPAHVKKVGLFVKQTVTEIADIMDTAGLDIAQLHGTYTAAGIIELKALTGKPVMWVRGISSAEDFDGVEAEMAAADMLLFDAKPPKDSDRPGGNAISFDWRLLADRQIDKPWMLAGGLNPDNVAEAMKLTGAKMVDISSGVESAPGVKDPDLMRAFISAAQPN